MLFSQISNPFQVRKEFRRGEEGGSVGSTHAAVLDHITAVAGRYDDFLRMSFSFLTTS